MPNPGDRLLALDAFRGITVAGMVLVNNPGTWEYVYGPLRHARWHGWTPTDLVFPFFLFIIGVAVDISLGRRRGAGADRRGLYLRAVRRAALLFALGVLLNAWEKYEGQPLAQLAGELRLPGVLQRIAVVYLAVAVLVIEAGAVTQAVVLAGVLLGYWFLMTLVPVPGYGAGDLSYPDHNFAAWLDRLLLGRHLGGKTWDGLGPTSTLPAIGSALAGVLTGRLLRSGRPKPEIAGRLFTLGWGAILLGLAWDLWFPINKLLWTSSYVVFTAGAALELLALCYWLIDVERKQGWARPAIVLGSNALTAFVLSTVVYLAICPRPYNSTNPSVRGWIYENLFATWANPYNASLGFAVSYVLLWVGFAWVLYQRRIFIRV